MKTLEQAGISRNDVAWFVPHNVNLRSWKILSDLIEVSEDKIWSNNIARVGHTVSCDHIINMRDMEDQGLLERGDILVLFTFGFGANWSCMIIEH
jgi:3-oxoacyl-[acyl-carrier-protein] synthase-3